MATQQTFLQVSQSGYTNVIDGHASLQNWRVKIILSCEPPSDLVLFVENNSMSEVYKWLKNLPGDLKLEKCSKEFESRGFHTLESLRYRSLRGHRCIFPVTGVTAVGRKTHLGKRN